ncbi:hypothetical protein BDD16_004585 [Sphaerotilus montanus]|uniref:Uncharacterized protein n=1 Tax=Sphaerotilus montanus TaxID=522889 RepID=A0A7Y9R2I1_9BURK|nr:hypothetical protein [Sphaerotilus montanus]
MLAWVIRTALGGTGGTGGVDDVGEVVWRGLARGAGDGLAGPEDGLVELEHGGLARGQAIEHGAVREQDRRLGVLNHEGEALWRIVGVEGDVGAAGLEDAEQPHDHLQGSGHAKPDEGVGLDALFDEGVGDLVGLFVELGVAQGLALEDHGGGVRGLVHLPLEEIDDGEVLRVVGLGPVPGEELRLVILGEDVDGLQRRVRLLR